MLRILSIDTSFAFTNISVICEGKIELLHYIHTDKKTLENMPVILEKIGIDYNLCKNMGLPVRKTCHFL